MRRGGGRGWLGFSAGGLRPGRLAGGRSGLLFEGRGAGYAVKAASSRRTPRESQAGLKPGAYTDETRSQRQERPLRKADATKTTKAATEGATATIGCATGWLGRRRSGLWILCRRNSFRGRCVRRGRGRSRRGDRNR